MNPFYSAAPTIKPGVFQTMADAKRIPQAVNPAEITFCLAIATWETIL
jgi:alpha-D-ribose 1-methylphosphonate 5-triphosphate synthase subunit PhnH